MIILEENSAGMLPDNHNTTLLQTTLMRYCLSLTKSRWDAEDLAQDTWVKALIFLKTSGNANPEALLLRIARTTWIDIVRRKSVLSRILRLEQVRSEERTDNGSLEIEAAFQALQEHLSPLQQAVFLIRDVFGHSASEAAEMLVTTEGAVKAALHRARQALPAVRKELREEGPLLPQNSELQLHLKRLASAYEKGQITELIKLTLLGEAEETVMAVGINSQTAQYGGYLSTGWSSAQPEMRMAA